MKFMARGIAILTVALMLLAGGGDVFAAGTCPQTQNFAGPNFFWVHMACTGDSADASFPAQALDLTKINGGNGWYLSYVATDPGGTSPTAAWDLAANMTRGSVVVDALGTLAENRSATVTESVNVAVPVVGSIAHTITGNLVNSATIATLYVFVR